MNLIISDFDGTFYDNNYEENIKFIESIKDKCDFVIATGRHFKSLKRDLKTSCKYYICNDGGYIVNDKEEIIYKKYLNDSEFRLVYDRIKELNYEDYYIDYIEYFDTKINDNASKISIKIKDNNAYNDMLYIINGLEETYGYLSENWMNILPKKACKEKAIDKLLKMTNYENIYVIGNEINDYGMLKKYNGYLITNEDSDKYNTVKSFIEIKDKINF